MVAFLALGGGFFFILQLPGWLIVDQQPIKSDAIVVLGGGREGRLRKAVRIYDNSLATLLILVGDETGDWINLIRRHCPECTLDSRLHVIINGSVSTMTDASLAHTFSRENNLRSLLVITDPYHSRRADLVFSQEFAGSGIDVMVMSSGEFGNLESPDGKWWYDRRTLEFVFVEFVKILYLELGGKA
jgi:uncharacterized SAM-binding protein YcdF (DUF218 family)